MISGFNGTIACKPFVNRQIETTKVGTGGRTFSAMNSKTLLTPLKVVFGSEKHDLQPGDEVYVLHETHASPWAREFEVEGETDKVCLVPVDQVKLVKRNRAASAG